MHPADLYTSPDLYDLVHQGHLKGELAFYARQAALAGDRVLELACGTGRLTWPLAALGLRLTGVDNAPAMLAVARQGPQAVPVAPRWVQADMRALPFAGAGFDVVFIGINSLGHLLTQADLNACLRGVRAALRPGGRLLLSVDNPSPQMMDGAEHRVDWGEFPTPDGASVRLTEWSRFDPATQVNQRRWLFAWPNGTTRERQMPMRLFTPAALLALVRANRLAVLDHWGKYTGQPFHHRAAMQVVVATPDQSG